MKKNTLTSVILALMVGTAALAQTAAAPGKKYQVRTRIAAGDTNRTAIWGLDRAIGVIDSVYSAKFAALEKKLQRVSTTANAAKSSAAEANRAVTEAEARINGRLDHLADSLRQNATALAELDTVRIRNVELAQAELTGDMGESFALINSLADQQTAIARATLERNRGKRETGLKAVLTNVTGLKARANARLTRLNSRWE